MGSGRWEKFNKVSKVLDGIIGFLFGPVALLCMAVYLVFSRHLTDNVKVWELVIVMAGITLTAMGNKRR